MIIDVSSAQGPTIDWAKVRASGVSGVIIQCSQGGSLSTAQRERQTLFKRWTREAYAEGLAVGAYHYAHPRPTWQDARDEGRLCTQAVDPVCDLLSWLCLDYEEFDAPCPQGKEAIGDWVSRWLEEAPGGCSTALYTGRAKCKRFPDWCSALPLWVSWYAWGYLPPPVKSDEIARKWKARESLFPWSRAWLWQYSSSGSVHGIFGRCDVNVDVSAMKEVK